MNIKVLKSPALDGFTKVQYKFPKSKRKRIRAKWAKKFDVVFHISDAKFVLTVIAANANAADAVARKVVAQNLQTIEVVQLPELHSDLTSLIGDIASVMKRSYYARRL